MPDEQGSAADRLSLRDLIRSVGLEPGPEQPCSYLPGRQARMIAFRADELPPGLYQSLMDLNFRRSGDVFYRPVCDACRQCAAVRVPTGTFQPNRSQRRCRLRNQDIEVRVEQPTPTEEKHALFQRYLRARHDRQMSGDWDDFCDFLYSSPINTLEVVYRLDGVLVGAGILDVEPEAVSTVYCYFDPELPARSIGTFNILWTIEYCLSRGIPYAYLGYYVADSRQMRYKINFRPCELLSGDDCWAPASTD